jgi:hypothetical protein
MSAPMTAGEAAAAFRSEPWARMPNDAQWTQTRDWFTAHWPAGGAVTGEQLQAALHAEELAVEVSAYSSMLGSFDERLDRAAARLSAQTVAVRITDDDIEETAAAIAKRSWMARHGRFDNVTQASMDMLTELAERLRARATTAGQATGVGAVTGEEFWTAQWPKGSPWNALSEETRLAVAAAAERLTDMLRARAGTAGQTTGAQWVRRPEPQAGALVAPEDGWYAKRFDNGLKNFSASNTFYKAGEDMVGSVAAIRRIDTDAPTTWIHRTPATAGGWTDLDVAACVGQHVVEQYDGTYSETQKWADDVDARCIATTYDATGVVAYYILPPVETQP